MQVSDCAEGCVDLRLRGDDVECDEAVRLFRAA